MYSLSMSFLSLTHTHPAPKPKWQGREGVGQLKIAVSVPSLRLELVGVWKQVRTATSSKGRHAYDDLKLQA